MTTKLAAAFAAVALAVGVLVGAAGTVLVEDAIRAPMGVTDMAAMHEMMGGVGGSMGPGGWIGPAQHGAHHPGSDQ